MSSPKENLNELSNKTGGRKSGVSSASADRLIAVCHLNFGDSTLHSRHFVKLTVSLAAPVYLRESVKKIACQISRRADNSVVCGVLEWLVVTRLTVKQKENLTVASSVVVPAVFSAVARVVICIRSLLDGNRTAMGNHRRRNKIPQMAAPSLAGVLCIQSLWR